MTRLSVYDPFAEVFPELFRGYLGPMKTPEGKALEIKVDVKESATDYTVHAEMPGIAKDDIDVQIDGNRVSISGEVKRESEKKDGERVLRSERYFGSVARAFTLASEIDDTKAQASFENGVLTLVLPKRAVAGGRKLTIG
jgi:HSP20 family protein